MAPAVMAPWVSAFAVLDNRPPLVSVSVCALLVKVTVAAVAMFSELIVFVKFSDPESIVLVGLATMRTFAVVAAAGRVVTEPVIAEMPLATVYCANSVGVVAVAAVAR